MPCAQSFQNRFKTVFAFVTFWTNSIITHNIEILIPGVNQDFENLFC